MSDDTKPDENPDPEAAPEDGEAPEDGATPEDGEAPEDGGPVAMLRKKLKLIIAGVAALGIIGGGAALFMSETGETIAIALSGKPQATMALPGPAVFHELAVMTVDLKPSKSRKRPFIRFVMTVELQENDVARLVEMETRVLDAAQSFLRTQTVEDLGGDAGTQKLRVKMTDIVNTAIAPSRAMAVLFKEIMVR